jgi:DNA-binding LacI/PurR family transcriptional regulator
MAKLLQQAQVPVVACGKPLGQAAVPAYVAADDRDGARQMVRHLVGSGRRRIATVTGPLDTPGGVERLTGYREVLEEAGLPYDLALVVEGEHSRPGGEGATVRLLEQAPGLDAIFVASDLMADGALATPAGAGRRVPEDVAVGGFDDSTIAVSTRPALTTVRRPWDRISSEMVRLLLCLVGGEPPRRRSFRPNWSSATRRRHPS